MIVLINSCRRIKTNNININSCRCIKQAYYYKIKCMGLKPLWYCNIHNEQESVNVDCTFCFVFAGLQHCSFTCGLVSSTRP